MQLTSVSNIRLAMRSNAPLSSDRVKHSLIGSSVGMTLKVMELWVSKRGLVWMVLIASLVVWVIAWRATPERDSFLVSLPLSCLLWPPGPGVNRRTPTFDNLEQ